MSDRARGGRKRSDLVNQIQTSGKKKKKGPKKKKKILQD